MDNCENCGNPKTMYWCDNCESNSESEKCECGEIINIDFDYHLNCNK